jgi:hypothetical protein
MGGGHSAGDRIAENVSGACRPYGRPTGRSGAGLSEWPRCTPAGLRGCRAGPGSRGIVAPRPSRLPGFEPESTPRRSPRAPTSAYNNSDFTRQPVMYAVSITPRRWSGKWRRSARSWSASKNPFRAFDSFSIGM